MPKKKLKILIVDDEKPVLKSLVRCFRKENYTIETCDRPTKALEILQQQKFQILLALAELRQLKQ